jgi:hypothetical protein
VPSAYTPLLDLALPVTGELDGEWGDEVNNQITKRIEQAVANYSLHTFTSVALIWELTVTDVTIPTFIPAEHRSAVLICTGSPGATCTIYAPKASKTYVVINNCADNSSVYLKGGPSTPIAAGVEIEAGGSAFCAWDANASDFVKVAGGGGGASGGGADQIFFENDLVVTTNYTLPPGKNAGTFGPVSIDSGVEVTIPTGQVWSIV